ncbi:MAG: pyridoxamine 5'-phosphate oxidase family protein [Candidatus Levybacteria bacterium]|nr:pyridoxamine 5'-phosphate oxidase family protein [Candidatus Levybacteria bacterium]
MKNKQKLLKYLKSRDLMILATNGPTASTFYYGIDDDFNFYIVTSPNSEHAKNFIKNPNVACVITDTNQKMFETKNKSGVQIKGVVKQVSSGQLKKALNVWAHANKEMAEKFFKNISEGKWKDKVYLIKPREIKWFNEKLYGEQGTETFRF